MGTEVKSIILSPEKYQTFLEAVEFYENTEDGITTYLLHRALDSRRHVRSKYVLYPLTQAEYDTVQNVIREFTQLRVK